MDGTQAADETTRGPLAGREDGPIGDPEIRHQPTNGCIPMPRNPAVTLVLSLLAVLAAPGAVCDGLTATNLSNSISCAEEDNINVPLRSSTWVQLSVRATHPAYPIAVPGCGPDFDAGVCCAADFTGCSAYDTTTGLLRSADLSCTSLPSDGINVFHLCRDLNWWRPATMRVAVGGQIHHGHRLVLNSKIADENSWPEVLVVYQDGNVRLKPHPPQGTTDACFGSSVILGPAAENPFRPFIDIAEIDIEPRGPCFRVAFADGDKARWCLRVSRREARLDVMPSARTDQPVATFRSMWVSDGNADVDRLDSGASTLPILGAWNTVNGADLVFRRAVFSRHNISAPDIRILANEVQEILRPRPWRFVPR